MSQPSTSPNHEALERRLRDSLLSPKVRADPTLLASVARGVLERVQTPCAKAVWWHGGAAPVIHTTRSGKGANRYADGRAHVEPEMGAPIYAGECIATPPATFAAVRWANGVTVWIGPDSVLAVEPTERSTSVARLLRGSMLSFVPPDANSALRVLVGRAEASTRNARWQLRVLAGGGARLDVLGGDVSARHDRTSAVAADNELNVGGRQSLHLGGGGSGAEEEAAAGAPSGGARPRPVALSRPDRQLAWIGALGHEPSMPDELAATFGMFFPEGFPAKFDSSPAQPPAGGKAPGKGGAIPAPSRRAVIITLATAAIGWAGWWWYKRSQRRRVPVWQQRPATDPLRVPPPRRRR
jgi:hypothetical protein